jgi:hypothetical protein
VCGTYSLNVILINKGSTKNIVQNILFREKFGKIAEPILNFYQFWIAKIKYNVIQLKCSCKSKY